MSRKGQTNPGSFQPGADPRRHVFTREERQRGGRAAFLIVATLRPEKVRWLQGKIKKTALTSTKARFRRRRRLYAKGLIEGSGY